MRRSHTEICIHLVWATWDRLDLIDEELEPVIFHYLDKKCNENKCWLEQIGGMPDHVHLLVRLTTTITIGQLVKSLKGSSSHYIAQIHKPGQFFKWRGGYSAYSISNFHVPKVSRYIKNQEANHLENSCISNWEL